MIFKIEARSNFFYVIQCLSNCGSRRSACGFETKTAKIASDTKRMEIHPHMSVLKLPLLVDFQQRVGELVPFISSCPSIIIVQNTLN
jgi:hypothetical protein